MTEKITKETKKPTLQSSTSLLGTLEHLTGALEIKPTNDYMFRTVLQRHTSRHPHRNRRFFSIHRK